MSTLMLSPHFSASEAMCKCCHAYMPDHAIALAQRLERARDHCGPIIVRSWHRCAARNRKVGGVPNSAHLRSYAVDIFTASSAHRFQLVSALLAAGFSRIGIGSSIVHADIDPSLPSGFIWTYYSDENRTGGPFEPRFA